MDTNSPNSRRPAQLIYNPAPDHHQLRHQEPAAQPESARLGCTEHCRRPAGLEQIYKLKGTISEQYPPVTRRDQERKKQWGKEEIPEKPVSIIVNCFPVILSEKPGRIYQYEVELNPVCASKALIRRLKYLLQEFYFQGELIGYDDNKNMFIAESTLQKKKEYLDREEIQFDIVPWQGATTHYVMNLRRVNVLSDTGFKEFLRGCQLPANCPSHFLDALQVVLRDGPSSLPFAVNKTSFNNGGLPALKLSSDGDPVVDFMGTETDYSVQPMRGFVKSLRAVELGLTLNLDSASMVFHQRKCVTHYLEGRGIQPWDLYRSQILMDTAKRMLVGLYVDIMQLPTYRKYKIADISDDPASACMLMDKEERMSVVQYYRTKYGIKIGPNFPCVIVRGEGENVEPDLACLTVRGLGDGSSHSCVLPMEACVIATGQKCGKGCRDRIVLKELRELAGADAEGRYRMIYENFKFLRHLFREGQEIDEQKFPSIEPFGIDIGDEMISVVGRLIPEPRLENLAKIKTANDVESNAVKAERSRGVWKLKKVFKSGRYLDAHEWDAIVFSDTATKPDDVRIMMNDILRICSEMSINCFKNKDGQGKGYDLCIQTSDSQSSEKLETAFRSMTQEYPDRLARIRFVFCIFHKNLEKPLYETVKRICETERGWITQCCSMERLNFETERIITRSPREGPSHMRYYEQIALKTNAKLGGINNALNENKFLSSLFGSKNQVILFGANVSYVVQNLNINDHSEAQRHSSAVNSRGRILLTMAASMEWPIPGQYYARVSLLRPKAKRVDIAHRLSAMAKELLNVHIEKNQGSIPTRAIFFRDGVSEGEFPSLVDKEFINLKQALKSICLGIKVSLIVAQRNQNTRFFIKNRDEDGNEVIENAETGTVVDRDITQLSIPPQLANFYLLSQSTKRNSLERPTHYFLLGDENDLSTNQKMLEKFLFYLCYTYATSSNSVAVVPPLLYAHEAASYVGASYAEVNADADIQPHANLIDTMYFC